MENLSSKPEYNTGNPQPKVEGFDNYPPDNYMVWAILSTLFCCLPLGIVSIVKASEVNNKWTMGDKEGAIQSSQQAKKWAIYAVVGGSVSLVLYIIFILLGVFASLANEL